GPYGQGRWGWATAARVGPRLAQHPRGIAWLSVLDFTGNGARRLARPIVLSGRRGPIPRITEPPRSAILSGSTIRTVLSTPIARAPMSASLARLMRRRKRRNKRFIAGRSHLDRA